MKRLIFCLCLLPALSFAQHGFITTIAGDGTYGYTGDGGPATAAQMGEATGSICLDPMGNLYVKDVNNRVMRQVDRSRKINTFPSSTMKFMDMGITALASDNSGNIFFVDSNRVQRVDAITGAITLVAGKSKSGYGGDGSAATNAQLNAPTGICLDGSGNLYIADEGNRRVRKVNTSGIISTYAGNGTTGAKGDGGPALSASIAPTGMCIDGKGNLFVADRTNNLVRKIDAVGNICTFAGRYMGYSGDGVPATTAVLNEPTSVAMDSYGDLFIAEFYNGRIRMVNTSGFISTYAGGGSSAAEGVAATATSLSMPWGVAVDAYNNVYVNDRFRYRIRKITGGGLPTGFADSFAVLTKKACGGPEISIVSYSYTPGMYVKTDYGDGSSDSLAILKAPIYGGYAKVTHTYNNTGTYTMTQVLYRGSTPIDTFTSFYAYTFCRVLPIRYYYDDNENKLMDTSEVFVSQPSLTQIDSNGVTIGNISATGGFNYYSYAPNGTVYSFKVTTRPGNLTTSAPSTGIISDTIGVPASYQNKYFGFSCPSKTSYDLSANTVISVTGLYHQDGTVYVSNAACDPIDATITFYFSPDWSFRSSSAHPPATTITGNSATWDIKKLFAYKSPKPLKLSYVLTAARILTAGDTVHSDYYGTPDSGDLNISNNVVNRVDTIRAGCDPNFVEVTPAGCIPAGTSTLRYTIHFENTGNDTAHNIYLLDTLPAEVDPGTLRLVMVSANMNISMLKNGATTVVRMDFPDINLLDTSHLGLCDGAVIFDIDLRKGLADGASFHNEAGIYFDDNDVVMTNAANSTMGCPVVLAVTEPAASKVRLYPNPATNELTIQTDGSYHTITVSNSLGQQLMQQPLNGQQTRLSIQQLPAGLYYVTVRGDNGTSVQKFVKL